MKTARSAHFVRPLRDRTREGVRPPQRQRQQPHLPVTHCGFPYVALALVPHEACEDHRAVGERPNHCGEDGTEGGCGCGLEKE